MINWLFEEDKTIKWGKAGVFSSNGAGPTSYHMQMNDAGSLFHTTCKN